MLISVDNSVAVSRSQCQEIGHRLAELNPKAENFLDNQLFPSEKIAPEDVARFFFFVTSIDHRTSPPEQSFEGLVNGEYFHGADLLWHLSLRNFMEDPKQFHPSVMTKITVERVTEWFTVNLPKQVTIGNPGERAALLRNGGQLLMKNYQGSVLNLLKAANNRVTSNLETASSGLLERLSHFKAYEDPAQKKSFLLLKFLLRRNLWSIIDDNRIRIPVDNHLTRIALRTGIVTTSTDLATHLRKQKPLALEIDVSIRKTIGDAYSNVGEFAKRSVLELDDFFWHFGRQCCLRENPICITGCTKECFVVEQLLNVLCQGDCPLSKVCPAATDEKQRALIEPNLETWYY